MVKITKVSVKNNYRLELTFDNGVCGVVDEKTGGGFSGTVPRIDLCLK